ncbi:acyl-CoA dehydrogenase [Rhodococcus erythropolis]|uniref:acyl-CoA dehydrogenase family protein n=1 Tax=Rhodococcus erythropolis TaxID=1833 RepID=UPI00061B701F|nr:acyl-CoA dehydrogenase family protein [Rhodococcus erythropolis]AKE00086.1 acyl-CoA dehydrogenase [Rhodococcus erythropolis]
MQRTVFDQEHEDFRTVIRTFIESEVTPNFSDWERTGMVPRDFYRQLGKLGVFGMAVPEQYGGAGETSFKFQAILTEETSRAAVTFGAFGVHTGLVLPYVLAYGTEEQKQRWLPDFISGDMMTAIAMTEPATGSDLAGIKTTAKISEDGTHYVLNGAKTFITGGVQADRVLVICRTSSATPENRRAGLSILAVDTTLDGYEVGRKLEKIGLRASDTAELSFTDVKVPAEDLLGEEGAAFGYLANNLPQERLGIAVNATASAAAAIKFASDYVRDRKVFGQAVAEFQNTKFVIAECIAKVEAAQCMVDRALELHETGDLSVADAAKAKLFCTENAADVIDKCLQLHGGYGYMLEYPIARLYADTRVSRIYGGTSEVMKTIIAKSAGF